MKFEEWTVTAHDDDYEPSEEELEGMGSYTMTLKEFLELCKAGAYVDDDGCGNPMVNDIVNDKIVISPSRLKEIPVGTTHILWHNK